MDYHHDEKCYSFVMRFFFYLLNLIITFHLLEILFLINISMYTQR